MQDLTVVYYTANVIPQQFFASTWGTLLLATEGLPIEVVSLKSMSVAYPRNRDISFSGSDTTERSHLNIYRQALIGAKEAKTRYIALCEDDVLYHKSHFSYRPPIGVFGYNMNVWSIYTWIEPAIFSYKNRRNLSQLICERDLFIEAIEERFAKYPDDSKTPIGSWGEPGKYENNLKITPRQSTEFYASMPNVAFSHETALSFENLGKRKRLGDLKAYEIPYWGKAEDIKKIYE